MAEEESRDSAYHLAGDRLGKFVILAELGRGSMGVVYEAFQEDLKRKVAIKIRPANIALDPKQVKRFRREAESVARLRHENIIQIYEVDHEANNHYFVMELVEGVGFQDIRGRDPDTIRRCATIVRDAARGLHHAHERGVIHRDVKPSNLLVDRGDRVLVTDFGLARLTDSASLTSTDAIVGTPKYMSPEQILPGTYALDGRTDVYSLGATLYEAVTGQPPLDAPSVQAFIKAILEDRPVAPRRRNRDVPHDLNTIILRCLEKEPDDRYASAAALADDLDRFLAGERIVAKPKGGVALAIEGLRRHRVIVSVGAVALAAIVLSAILGGKAAEQSRERDLLTELADLSRSKNLDEAIEQTEEIVARNPSHVGARELRADLYGRRATAHLEDVDVNFEQVLDDLERAGQTGSYWYAMMLVETGRLDDAKAAAESLLPDRKALVLARVDLGQDRAAAAVERLKRLGDRREAFHDLVLAEAYCALAREVVASDADLARARLDEAFRAVDSALEQSQGLDQKWLRARISLLYRDVIALLGRKDPLLPYLPFVSGGFEKSLAQAQEFWRTIRTPEMAFAQHVANLAGVGEATPEDQAAQARKLIEGGKAALGHLLLAVNSMGGGRTEQAMDELSLADESEELRPYVWWGQSLVFRAQKNTQQALTAVFEGLTSALVFPGSKPIDLEPMARLTAALAEEAHRNGEAADARRALRDFLDRNQTKLKGDWVSDFLRRVREAAAPAPPG